MVILDEIFTPVTGAQPSADDRYVCLYEVLYVLLLYVLSIYDMTSIYCNRDLQDELVWRQVSNDVGRTPTFRLSTCGV